MLGGVREEDDNGDYEYVGWFLETPETAAPFSFQFSESGANEESVRI